MNIYLCSLLISDSEPLQPEVKAGILGGVNHTCIKLLRGKVVDSDAEIHVYDTDVTLPDERMYFVIHLSSDLVLV